MWVTSGPQRMIADSGRYEAFPDATVLPSGRIVVAWSSFESHYGPGHPRVARSDNGGATWSASQPLVAGAGHVGVAAIASLGNRVAVLHMSLDTPERSGWVQLSSDGGLSWAAPRQITGWGNSGWVYVSDLLWVDDGSTDGLMLVTSYGPDGVLLMASTDAGVSWTKRATVVKRGVWQDATETSMLRLPGGDLLMLLRNDTLVQIEALRSSDMGVTWSTPTVVWRQMSGLPRMTMMHDGTILATLRYRRAEQSSWAMGYSRDLGQSWHLQHVDPGRMMYGRFLSLPTGQGRLVGATDDRNAYGASRVWIQDLRVSQISLDMTTTPLAVDLFYSDIPAQAKSVTLTRTWNGRSHRVAIDWAPGRGEVRVVDHAAPVASERQPPPPVRIDYEAQHHGDGQWSLQPTSGLVGPAEIFFHGEKSPPVVSARSTTGQPLRFEVDEGGLVRAAWHMEPQPPPRPYATYILSVELPVGTLTHSVDVWPSLVGESQGWLSDPLDPGGAVLVDVMSSGDDSMSWPGEGGGLIAPMGGFAISTGRRRTRTRAWRIKTHDAASRDAVIGMIERGSVLLLRGDPECLDHPDGIVHMDVAEPSMDAILVHRPERWFNLSGVEVAAPSQAILVPQRTWRDDLEEQPTFRESLATFPTFLARTRGVV